MKNFVAVILKKTPVLLCYIGIFCAISCTNIEKKGQTGYQTIDSGQTDTLSCLVSPSWFPHENTPPPKEGIHSPFDASETTNLIFHQWSWQKFLWLTKPVDTISLLPILVQGTPEILILKSKIPLFLKQEQIHQVTSSMKKVPQQFGTTVVLTDTGQAGSGGVLKTNPAFNNASNSATVYYSIHVSPTMFKAAHAFKDSIVIEKTLDPNNSASFPVSSLELKVSWVDASVIPSDQLSNYFITVAALSSDGGITFTNTNVALLGMHVVGVVENHPEFIWATFEHNDLAPNYNWKTNAATSTTEKLLFKSTSTSGIDGITWVDSTKATIVPYKAFDLFQFGVPVNADGYLETSQSEPLNFNNIEGINICVKNNLKDVWANYFYNGSIWLDTDGMSKQQQANVISGLRNCIANADVGSFARGSLNSANVTMETYTQTFQDSIHKIDVGNLASCFSCHSGESYTGMSSPIYLSHIFNSFILSESGKTLDEIELLKAKQEIEQILQMMQ